MLAIILNMFRRQSGSLTDQKVNGLISSQSAGQSVLRQDTEPLFAPASVSSVCVNG